MADCSAVTFSTAESIGFGSVRLAWANISCSEGYQVEYGTDQTNWILYTVLPNGSTGLIVHGLDSNTAYYFRVTTYSKCDSDIAIAGPITTSCSPVTTPWGVDADDMGGYVLVSWLSPIPEATAGVTYEIYRSLNGGAYNFVGSTANHEYIDSVDVGDCAGYEVRMVSCGTSGSLSIPTAFELCPSSSTSTSTSSSGGGSSSSGGGSSSSGGGSSSSSGGSSSSSGTTCDNCPECCDALVVTISGGGGDPFGIVYIARYESNNPNTCNWSSFQYYDIDHPNPGANATLGCTIIDDVAHWELSISSDGNTATFTSPISSTAQAGCLSLPITDWTEIFNNYGFSITVEVSRCLCNEESCDNCCDLITIVISATSLAGTYRLHRSGCSWNGDVPPVSITFDGYDKWILLIGDDTCLAVWEKVCINTSNNPLFIGCPTGGGTWNLVNTTCGGTPVIDSVVGSRCDVTEADGCTFHRTFGGVNTGAGFIEYDVTVIPGQLYRFMYHSFNIESQFQLYDDETLLIDSCCVATDNDESCDSNHCERIRYVTFTSSLAVIKIFGDCTQTHFNTSAWWVDLMCWDCDQCCDYRVNLTGDCGEEHSYYLSKNSCSWTQGSPNSNPYIKMQLYQPTSELGCDIAENPRWRLTVSCTECPEDCTLCPNTITVLMSGWNASGCSNECDNLNNSFVLTKAGASCTWTGTTTFTIASVNYDVDLQLSPFGGQWMFSITSNDCDGCCGTSYFNAPCSDCPPEEGWVYDEFNSYLCFGTPALTVSSNGGGGKCEYYFEAPIGESMCPPNLPALTEGDDTWEFVGTNGSDDCGSTTITCLTAMTPCACADWDDIETLVVRGHFALYAEKTFLTCIPDCESDFEITLTRTGPCRWSYDDHVGCVYINEFDEEENLGYLGVVLVLKEDEDTQCTFWNLYFPELVGGFGLECALGFAKPLPGGPTTEDSAAYVCGNESCVGGTDQSFTVCRNCFLQNVTNITVSLS